MDWSYWSEFDRQPARCQTHHLADGQRGTWRQSRPGSFKRHNRKLSGVESNLPAILDLQWFTDHIARLDNLLADESTDVAALSDRGKRYHRAGLMEASIADQRRALDINPHSWRAWSRLLDDLMHTAQHEELLDKAQWRYHDEPTLRNLRKMAWYQIQLGHPEGLRSLELVLQHPDLEKDQRQHFEGLRVIGLSGMGRTQESLDILEHSWPNTQSCYCDLMSRQHNLLMKAGRDVEALERRETFLQFRCDSEMLEKEPVAACPPGCCSVIATWRKLST